MNKLDVYIADDQTLFRKGMANLLRTFPNVGKVMEAENGKVLIDMIKKQPPDVALVDLEMPVLNGFEACKTIIRKHPGVKVIVLSMHNSEDIIFEVMELGVQSYLVKNADPEEVQRAISAVITNDFYYNDLVATALRNGVRGRAWQSGKNPLAQEVQLSTRELEVLSYICHEYTTREIAEKLNLSEKTVKNHRNNLIEKVKARNTVGLVKFALEHKLVSQMPL